jgi:hypothetical protein
MAISDSQKVDYLWKKIGYSAAKTANTTQGKDATQESIPSPLQIRGDKILTQASGIPATLTLANTSTTGIVTVYPATAPLEMPQTPVVVDVNNSLLTRGFDDSVPANRTFRTGLTDWVSPEFGSTYAVRIFTHTAGSVSTASTSGTELSAADGGKEWFFDYQAGILHFIGDTVPTSVSGKSVYISGARYTGELGFLRISGGTF